jgi:hypothetical protein
MTGDQLGGCDHRPRPGTTDDGDVDALAHVEPHVALDPGLAASSSSCCRSDLLRTVDEMVPTAIGRQEHNMRNQVTT